MIFINLPYPPTANTLYANGKKGRYRTARYETWLRAAGNQLNQQSPRRITGQYSITLLVEKIDNRKRDLSNLIKAPSDLLVKHGIIEDDSLEQRVVLEWSNAVKGCTVILEPVEPSQQVAA